ncbi:Ig-like domain-containing protein [Nakamurella flavida]|uniref:Ig-like domain-containing protein n=1 Tax=Nakamurella flavida TaxID=363630 RepID=A0A939C2Q7_9ACTN|nr:Ig-like domain-containing protein [Nakamurella flavida]MBM9476835.1 Ig-like domain-containing protein [Nakamurella flavida]MDP9778723.1 hypothetical protein [Nakamurella flavida]
MAVLLGTLLQVTAAPAAGAAEDTPTNLAPVAIADAQYTAPWNSLAAINDGRTPVAPGAGLGEMWGSYSGDRPAELWVSYRWTEPVTVTRSAMSFWSDAPGPGTGDNVWAPESWRLQYLPVGSEVWTDIPGVDVTGVALGEPNVSTFPAVTTTAVRALLRATGNADGSSFAALSITEWEIWGTTDDIPPPSPTDPLAADEVHLPVAVDELPTLPATVWMTYPDGLRRELAVTWPTVTAEQLGTAGTSFVVAGTAAGVRTAVSATVYVRAAGTDPAPRAVRPVAALTVVGTAPQLPSTVSVEYADDSVDSRIPVRWASVPEADYASAGVFEVAGDVDGGLRVVALVVVDEPVTDQPPLVRLTTDIEAPSSGWNTGPVQVSVTASSATDPAPRVEIAVDDGDWQPAAGPVLLSTDGTHTVQTRATDAQGRVSDVRSLTVRIDTTAPVTTAQAALRDTDVALTLTAVDDGSGVATTQYQVGDGFIATYTGPVPITRAAQAQTVRYFSTDTAGNVESAGTVQVPALAVAGPPTATAALSPAAPDGENGWYVSTPAVTVTAAASDGTAATAEVGSGSGGWTPVTGPIALRGQGLASLTYRAVDAAGQQSPVGRIEARVDTARPIVTGGVSGTGAGRLLTLLAADAASGVDTRQVRLDGGDWVDYVGPVSLTAAAHTAALRARDVAGHETVVTVSVPRNLTARQLTTTTAVQCRAGRPELAVDVVNTGRTTSRVTVTGPLGNRSVPALAAHAATRQTFPVTGGALAAGEVTVVAFGTQSGATWTQRWRIPYDALTCG